MHPTINRFRLVLVTGLVLLSLIAFAGTVSANACHMGAASGVGEKGGMAHAMSVNNPNGNEGMFRAIDESLPAGSECAG